MTIVSKFLETLYASTPVKSPFGFEPPPPRPPAPPAPNSHLVPNPNDAKLSTPHDMDIEDQAPLVDKISNIIDSLSDDQITDELADIVESFLDTVDPEASMGVKQAALMLTLEDCQDLYEELTSYLDKNGISFSEEPSYNSIDIPNSVPSDAYPDARNMILAGSPDARGGSFTI